MKELKTLKDLEGKKIKKVWVGKISEEYDDIPFLFMAFEDDTTIKIIADYGGFTGESEDEYKRIITVENWNGRELK